MKKNMKNQKGFSLIELLVVVIIIGIIAAIAIPSLLASRRAANEGSAIASVRSLGTAQATYQATTGNGSFAADNTALAGIVDGSLDTVGEVKSGYAFTTSGAGQQMCVFASPSGSGGVRFFGMEEDYVLESGTATFTCAAGVYGGGGTVTILGN